MTFQNLGLSTELLRAVSDEGYTVATPIQQRAIPPILEGRDMIALSQTGTGKTAGFTLPLLQRLSAARTGPDRRSPRAPILAPTRELAVQVNNSPDRRAPRALILAPTRELAVQVNNSIETYGKYLSLESVAVFGGANIERQIQRLRRGVDIAVATPGRLLDHLARKSIDLGAIEILVLDECDRMLDMGFIHDIRKILAKLPADRQTLMFSATFSPAIRQLAGAFLDNPVQVEVAPRNTAAERVEQIVHPIARERKRELLSYLIGFNNWQQVLVFTRTKRGANRLAEQLTEDGLKTAAIHGNKSQAARTRALSDFKLGKIRVLVATDIASRGLDIDGLPHVINFELPDVPEDYVHRIGRTGRAGREGQAISLVSSDEDPLLKDIEKLLNRKLARDVVAGYEPTAPARSGQERQPAAPGRGDRSGESPRGNAPRKKKTDAPRQRKRKRPDAA
jgi:ATP-dependent RNA helicase RhlE